MPTHAPSATYAQEGRTTWQDDLPVLMTPSQERTMAFLRLRDGTKLYYKDYSVFRSYGITR